MTSWNKDEVAELLRQSAGIALKYFDAPRLDYKKDQTVVTQADREIEHALAAVLDRPEEGSWLLGEETLESRSEDYIREALAGTAWIVDPIDGTASYAHHFPMWAISIGFAQGADIQEGAVYLPMEGELLVSEGPGVYYGRVAPASNAKVSLVPFRARPAAVSEKIPIAIAQRSLRRDGYTGRNVLQATGSAVFSLTHLMLGHYLAYKADLKLWDLAGGLALLTKLGFACRFEDGGVFSTRITEDNYALSPAAGLERWRARGTPVFAASGEAFDYVRSCFQAR
jgi:myo-inositol-1(or 4)-monophosphatase